MLKKTVFLIVVVSLLYMTFVTDEKCEKYSSKFSCNYVEKEANYEVYYWINVFGGDELNNKLIGSTIGLQSCRDIAVRYSNLVKDQWSDRAYVCMLMKDGRGVEKHRL